MACDAFKVRVSGFSCSEQIGTNRTTDRNSRFTNNLRMNMRRDWRRRCLLFAEPIAANRLSAI